MQMLLFFQYVFCVWINRVVFFIISSESAEGVCDSCSVEVKVVWKRGSGVGKVIWISFVSDEDVLISRLFISLISFCIMFPCLGVGVLKFSISILSIWIWLNFNVGRGF
jgi:hypothetical protein